MLTLRVRRYRAAPVQTVREAVFDRHGGTLGRADDNDWVLPDSECFVSGHHATVEYWGGVYYLKDTSSNGTYINDVHRSADALQSVRLCDGDTLRIGEYEIEALIANDEDAPRGDVAEGLPTLLAGQGVIPAEGAGAESAVLALQTQVLGPEPPPHHPLSDLHTSAQPSPLSLDAGDAKRAGAEPDHTPADRAFFRPPKVDIPENWDVTGVPDNERMNEFRERLERVGLPLQELGRESASPLETPAAPAVPDQKEVASSAPSRDADDLLDAFCEAAGLSREASQSVAAHELMARAGSLLREAVRGTQALARSRSEMKEEIRATRTLAWKVSNPLKNLAASPEEVMERLLCESGPETRDGAGAMTEIMGDLKAHQLATLAGMSAAIHAVSQRLDPQRFDTGQRRRLAVFSDNRDKAEHWDAFKTAYAELVGDEENLLREILRNEFVQAYEEELDNLSSTDVPLRPPRRPA